MKSSRSPIFGFRLGKPQLPERTTSFVSMLSIALAAGIQLGLISGVQTTRAAQSTPDFGTNVLVFDPVQKDMQERVYTVFKEQERAQFGKGRYAFLFKPGKYSLDIPIGFYTHIAGLGKVPGDVTITGGIWTDAAWMRRNATCNFWRSVENLTIEPTIHGKTNLWAISQAAPMRRTHIKGDLHLSSGGWSSGGFLADCVIEGRIVSGSQQQWLSRNSQWERWVGGSWNMVFVGTVNPPPGEWPKAPYTVIEKTPLIREKPYLSLDEKGDFCVRIPELQTDTRGITWENGHTAGVSISISKFHIAFPGKDTAASINTALRQGKHLLLTPGHYQLEESIRVTQAGTVVFGLGFPTLVPTNGAPAMTIADVDGVNVAGILFDAGAPNSAVLLQVGEPGSNKSHSKNPIGLYDIFCRVGGATIGTADCMVVINSHDVIGDNFWLWRADHGAGASWTANKNKNGLIVNGDNVTIYGLFVEHTQEYQTLWNGNNGRVFFYQSEMPYDPPSSEGWRHDDVNGYASYKVADNVKTHEAWGLGVYCVFRRGPIVADNAIETPIGPGIKMRHMVTIRLGGGQPGSGIKHVINGQGESVINNFKATID